MLVNVSNSASGLDETVHVLKFSAIASKVCGYVTGATGDRKVMFLAFCSLFCSCYFTGDPHRETGYSSMLYSAASP